MLGLSPWWALAIGAVLIVLVVLRFGKKTDGLSPAASAPTT